MIRIRRAGPILLGNPLITAAHTLAGKRVLLHHLRLQTTATVNTTIALIGTAGFGGVYARTGANSILAANVNMVTSINGVPATDVYLDSISNVNHSALRGNFPCIVQLDECYISSSAVSVLSITDIVMYVELLPNMLELNQ